MSTISQPREGIGVANVRQQLESGDDHLLWDQARARFARGMEHQFLSKGSDDVREDFHHFISSWTSISQARNQCRLLNDSSDKQYSTKPLTIKGHTIIPKDFLKSVLANMDAFIKLGDLATKGGAESVSVGWSCVKFVLQAVQADSANCTRWAQAADSISRILLNCQTFARLYSMPDSNCKPSNVADDLLSMVPSTYGSILAFTWAAYQQLGHCKARRMLDQLNPFSKASNASSSALDNILSCDDTMQRQSQIAFQQVSHEAFGELLRGHDKLEGLLVSGVQEILSQLSGLDDPDRADLLRFQHNVKLLLPSDHSEEMYSACLKERQKGTCSWVFDLPAFQQWHVADKSALLWIHGNAGCGKTMLITSIIEKLQDGMDDHNGIIAYYFCRKSGNTGTKSAALNVKRDLVYRLYNELKHGPYLSQANAILASQKGKQSQAGQSESPLTNVVGSRSDNNVFPDLTKALVSLAKLLEGPIYLIVDAPDECSDYDDDLRESISAWSRITDCKLKVITATRPRPDLERLVADNYSVDIEKYNRQDISLKVTTEVLKIPGLSEHERCLLIDKIVEKADTQFAYIALAMDLLRQPWKRPIEKVLDRLSDGINGMYQQILRNTNPSFAELAREALKWTLLRQDDLPIDTFFDIYSDRYVGDDTAFEGADSRIEANVAVLRAGADRSSTGLGPDNKFFQDQISEAVGQFIDVVGSNGNLVESHKSVSDCFLSHDAAPMTRQHNMQSLCLRCAHEVTRDDSFHVYAEDHLHIATRILQHLNSPTFRTLYFRELPDMTVNPTEMSTGGCPPSELDDSGSDDPTHVLLDTSVAAVADENDLQNFQGEFVVNYLKTQAARKAQELHYDDDDSDDNMDAKAGKTPLDLCGEGWHAGLQLGYVATALALIDADEKSAAKNRMIMMAAATHGGIDVVEKLLSIGAEYNFKDNHEWSPMLSARYHGHLEIVRSFEREDSKGERPSRMFGTYTSAALTSDHATSIYRFLALDQGITIQSDHPIPANLTKYYFEVTIMDAVAEAEPGWVAVGLSTAITKVPKSWIVGHPATGISSWGYHGDDETVIHDKARGAVVRKLYKPYGPGDTIGCALFTDTGSILYTRNGQSLGVVVNDIKGRLFPSVGLAKNAVVKVNLGKEGFRWEAANSADDTKYSK